MLSFSGERDFPQPPEALAAKLSDARFLARCIPGVESVAKAEADEVVCTIRPGFAFVRGTLDVTVRVVEAVPAQSVRLAIRSKGIGSTSDVEADLLFAPLESGGAKARWEARVTQLGGLLKAVPQGLIRATADKVLADAWAQIEANLRE